MDARPKYLHEIIEGEKQYVVPVFQRYYSWDEKHWENLWDDILSLVEGEGISLEHFIGTFVCMADRHTPDAVPRYILIDGQQRIVTLTILLCALRDFAKENIFNEKADEIQEKYLIDKHKKEMEKYKVISRSKDRQFLIDLLDEKPAKEGNNITTAYNYFVSEIEDFFEDETELEKLFVKLVNTITKQLTLVIITLGEEENPWAIFETLNERGLKLEESDLIRNYVFMKLPLNKQDKFDEEEWTPFEEIFKETDEFKAISLTDFYRDYLMRRGVYVKKNETYIQFKEQNEDVTPQKLVKLLKRYAIFYSTIHRPSTAPKPELATELERIQYLDVGTSYPLILRLCYKYSVGSLSLDNFIACLQALESFVIRRAICRESTRGYGYLFPRIIRNFKKDILSSVLGILQISGWPTNEAFKDALLEFELYRKEPKKCRLILEELEKSYKHKEPVDLTINNIEIEHIMPQTLSEDWKETLGDAWEEIHSELLHTIGNLTLSGYNQELYNHPFEEKKVRLEQSNLELNNYFSDIDTWNESAIKSRGEMLADEIIKIWGL